MGTVKSRFREWFYTELDLAANDILNLNSRISCVNLTDKPEETHMLGDAIQLERGGDACLFARSERSLSKEPVRGRILRVYCVTTRFN